MFEDSLFSSRVAKRSRRTRWIAAASVGLQGTIVAGLVMAPLVWPERLPAVRTAPQVATVALMKAVKAEPLKPRVVRVTNEVAMRVPSNAAAPVMEARRGGMITAAAASAETAPTLALGNGMSSGPSLGVGLVVGLGAGLGCGLGTGGVAVASARSSAPVRVSSGVSAGLLLTPIVPCIRGLR